MAVSDTDSLRCEKVYPGRRAHVFPGLRCMVLVHSWVRRAVPVCRVPVGAACRCGVRARRAYKTSTYSERTGPERTSRVPSPTYFTCGG